MIHNQKILSEMILEEKKNSDVILVPIKITPEKEIKIYISEEQKWANMLFLKN